MSSVSCGNGGPAGDVKCSKASRASCSLARAVAYSTACDSSDWRSVATRIRFGRHVGFPSLDDGPTTNTGHRTWWKICSATEPVSSFLTPFVPCVPMHQKNFGVVMPGNGNGMIKCRFGCWREVGRYEDILERNLSFSTENKHPAPPSQTSCLSLVRKAIPASCLAKVRYQ